jgi:hypothetical protein
MCTRRFLVRSILLCSSYIVSFVNAQDFIKQLQSLPINYNPSCAISDLYLEYNIHNSAITPSRIKLIMGTSINLDTLMYRNGTGINIVAETNFSTCLKPVQCVQLKLGPYNDDDSLIINSVIDPPYVLYSGDESIVPNQYYPKFIGWMNVYATAYSTFDCTGNPNTDDTDDDGNDIRTAVHVFRTIQLLRNSTDPDDTQNSTTTNTTCAVPKYNVYNSSSNMIEPLVVYQQSRWPYQSRILLDQYIDKKINILVEIDTSPCATPPVIQCVKMQLGNFTKTMDSVTGETQYYELFPTSDDSEMTTTDIIEETGWQLLKTYAYTKPDCTGPIVSSNILNIDFVPISEQAIPISFVANYTAPELNATGNGRNTTSYQPDGYIPRGNGSETPDEIPILSVLTRPPTLDELKDFVKATCDFLCESYKTIHPPNLIHVTEKFKCYGNQTDINTTGQSSIVVKFSIKPVFRINPVVGWDNDGIATLPSVKLLYHDLVLLFTDALCTMHCMSTHVRNSITEPIETSYYYPYVQQFSTIVPVVKVKTKLYKYTNPFIAQYNVPDRMIVTNSNQTRAVVYATCQYISKVFSSGWYDTQFISFNHSQFRCWRELPISPTPYQIIYRFVPTFTFGQYNNERNFNGNLLDFPEYDVLERDIKYMFLDEKKIKNNDNSVGGDGGITMSTFVKEKIQSTNPYFPYTSIDMT